MRVQLAELPTPFARIDPDRLAGNIAWMQAWVASRGAALRPHFKTHRSADVAQHQLQAGAVGFTCSDVAQLNALLLLGIEDIFVSSAIQLDAGSWPMLRRAAASQRVTFSVSSHGSVEHLRRAVGPGGGRVWLEIEVGGRRTGVAPRDAPRLAHAATAQGLDVCGIFSYPGGGYAPGAPAGASRDERRCLREARDLLVAANVDVEHVSAGCSPTVVYAERGVITEYRPGTYALRDRQQEALDTTSALSTAMSIVSTVLHSDEHRVVVDAGAKSLGRDAPSWLSGHGRAENAEGKHVTRLYDHHAVFDAWPVPRPEVGQRLGVIPNNVNSSLALQSAVVFAPSGAEQGDQGELVHDT